MEARLRSGSSTNCFHSGKCSFPWPILSRPCPFPSSAVLSFLLETYCWFGGHIKVAHYSELSRSYWETQNLDAATVGSRMSEFAIGSLAAMANLNPHTQIRGTLPNLGYQLSVEWNYVAALATGIGVVHCLLVALVLWISRPVIVGTDSNIATARTLKGMVEKLGDRGGLLDDREMAEAIQRNTGDVGYGVRESGQGMLLELGEGTTVRKRLPGGRFPTGQYA